MMMRLSPNEYDFNNRIRVLRINLGRTWCILDIETHIYFKGDDGEKFHTKDLAVALDTVYNNGLNILERPELNPA